MKAGKVRHLDPDGTLAANAERIVRARLAELCSFAPAVLRPEAVSELHDMRIAAKRLRYVLEVTARPCFGPYARTAGKRARELQDLLGEIHDCDVQLPRVERLVTTLRDADAEELRRRAGDADDLDPALAARLPHADAWRGLVALETYLRARRTLLYDRFRILWRDLEREGFSARLEYAIGERPEIPAEAARAQGPAQPPEYGTSRRATDLRPPGPAAVSPVDGDGSPPGTADPADRIAAAIPSIVPDAAPRSR